MSTNYSNSLIYSEGESGFKILGNLSLDGNNQIKWGLMLASARDALVTGVSFINWASRGCYIVGSGVAQKGVRLDNCFVEGCNVGIDIIAEYCRVTSCTAYGNTIGMSNTGGNNRWTACSSTYNTTNFRLRPAANGGHGVSIGCDFNHATSKNLLVENGFILGWTFVGCHFYDSVGSIDLNGSGVSFVGGDIACPVISSGTLTGITDMNGVHFNWNGQTATFILSTLSPADRAKVKLYSCKDKDQTTIENEQARITYPEFIDNTAALAGGLEQGEHYRITGTGEIRVVTP